MSRRDVDRLDEIAEAVGSYTGEGGLDSGLVFDAVRMRLLEIGEAVKALPADLTASEPGVPWRDVAGLRDRLAHRYFDTDRCHRCNRFTACPTYRPPWSSCIDG